VCGLGEGLTPHPPAASFLMVLTRSSVYVLLHASLQKMVVVASSGKTGECLSRRGWGAGNHFDVLEMSCFVV
jgi:hypothetical protein